MNIEMNIPKKGSRKINVGENEFLWLIRPKPTYSQDCLGSEITAVVEPVELSGTILRITFPFSRPDASLKLGSESVTPSMIERCIKNAISQGWNPKASSGTFEYRYTST
ncbi:hypothetical protein [Cellvibrio sp. pealriver]|uniref:hypothetical protein n=1 Tax=Cellvibrio sp. pealriver TaxID=1622269 RepID=UPI0018CDC419|nr:hypothetical protein [Cellvibrio sp. pealriver]